MPGVLRYPDRSGQAGITVGVIEQAELEFDTQDAADRIIDAFDGDITLFDGLFHDPREGEVIIRNHAHIDTGIDARHDRVVIAAVVDLSHAAPVGDNKAIESQFAFENIRNPEFGGMHLDPVPAAIGDHDGLSAVLDSRLVWRQE